MAIIKKGTYRWKNDITFPGNAIHIPEIYNPSITLTDLEVEHEGQTFRITSTGEFETILASTDDVLNQPGPMIIYSSANEAEGIVINVYNESGELVSSAPLGAFAVYLDGQLGDYVNAFFGYGLEFNITRDLDMTDDEGIAFANWFIENTTMLIKAGTYRWNDIPSYPPDSVLSGASLPFTSNSSNFDVIGIEPFDDGQFILVYINDTTEEMIPVYITSSVSTVDFVGWLDNYQFITVDEDVYIPTDFGLWATSNWQPYVEPIPMENVTITLTYKGTPFLTITNGEITTPTTSATSVEIPTADYSFTENIKIEITKS